MPCPEQNYVFTSVRLANSKSLLGVLHAVGAIEVKLEP